MSENITTQEALQLRVYELTIIIAPETPEEKTEAIISSVGNYVTQRGGEVSPIQRWGRRRLAYPIKHFTEGYYVFFQFKMKPEHGKELENNLRISEEVLRYLLINNE